jgi:hypothetical protein
LSECGDFTVLSKVKLERTGELLHDLARGMSVTEVTVDYKYARLGSRADTRHRETDVDSRTDTTEEELSLQEDLAVSDRNDL